jgi:hypothetical protein
MRAASFLAVAVLNAAVAAGSNGYPLRDFGYSPWTFALGLSGDGFCYGTTVSQSFPFPGRWSDDPAIQSGFNGNSRNSMELYSYHCTCLTPVHRVCVAANYFDYDGGIVSGGLYLTAQFRASSTNSDFVSVLDDEFQVAFNYEYTHYLPRDTYSPISPVFGPSGEFRLSTARGFHDMKDYKLGHFLLNAGVWTWPDDGPSDEAGEGSSSSSSSSSSTTTSSKCFVPGTVSDVDVQSIEATARAAGKGFTCMPFAAGAVELCAVTQTGSTISWVLQREPGTTKRVLDIAETSVSAPAAVIGAPPTQQQPLCDGFNAVPYFQASLDFQVNPAEQSYEIMVNGKTRLAAWKY